MFSGLSYPIRPRTTRKLQGAIFRGDFLVTGFRSYQLYHASHIGQLFSLCFPLTVITNHTLESCTTKPELGESNMVDSKPENPITAGLEAAILDFPIPSKSHKTAGHLEIIDNSHWNFVPIMSTN